MKKEIKEDLKQLFSNEIVKEVFNQNILSHSLIGYKKGKMLTFGELKELPEDTILNVVYKDENYQITSSIFDRFDKCDYDISMGSEYWSIGSYPIPLENLVDEQIIENIRNCNDYFTVYEAINFNN